MLAMLGRLGNVAGGSTVKKRRHVGAIAAAASSVLLSACWLPQLAPTPQGQTSGDSLSSIACPSTTFCVAIGSYQVLPPNNNGPQVFVDTLSDNHWAASELPLPGDADGPEAALEAVSCPIIGSCVALGFYTLAPNNEQGLIETLADGAWSAAEAPLPSDAALSPQSVGFSSLSCAGDGTCAAIGTYLVPGSSLGQEVLETRVNGKWTATTPVEPSNAAMRSIASVSAVSCASKTTCTGIGYYSTADGSSGLIEYLSDGQWQAKAAPIPGAQSGIDLDGISCMPSGTCIVTGSYTNSSGPPFDTAVVGTISGGTWTTTAAPSPPGVSVSESLGFFVGSPVCSPDGSCAALGSYADASNKSYPFAETYSSGTWSAELVPTPANAVPGETVLGPISCASGLACSAIGSYMVAGDPSPHGFIDTLSNGSWSETEEPLPGNPANVTGYSLADISCPSATFCFATGNYGTRSFPVMNPIIVTGIKLSLGTLVTQANNVHFHTMLHPPQHARPTDEGHPSSAPGP